MRDGDELKTFIFRVLSALNVRLRVLVLPLEPDVNRGLLLPNGSPDVLGIDAVDGEMRALIRGEWGRPPAAIDPDVLALAAASDATPPPAATDIEAARAHAGELATSEEELCLVALFGEDALPLLERLRGLGQLRNIRERDTLPCYDRCKRQPSVRRRDVGGARGRGHRIVHDHHVRVLPAQRGPVSGRRPRRGLLLLLLL